MTTGRIEGADTLRALATVGVIIVHADHWPPTDRWIDWRIYTGIDLIARFSVPAFVVLTGIVLGYTYRHRPVDAVFARKRLRRTIIPWLVWAPAYFLIGWFITRAIDHTADGAASWWEYGGGHLYFLLLIPQLYALYAVWRARHPWIVAAGCIGAQLALSVYRLSAPLPGGAVEQLAGWHAVQLFPFWAGYFAAGVVIGRAVHPATAWHPPAVAAALVATVGSAWLLLTIDVAKLPGYAVGTGEFLLPMLSPLVLSIVGLTLASGGWLLRPRVVRALVRMVSDNSLGIYIIHPLVLYIVGMLMPSLNVTHLPQSLPYLLVLVLAPLLLSLGLTSLISTSPLAPMVGAR